MADLNESVKTVVKKTWDRSHKIRVENNYGQTPKIIFEVQTATSEDGVFTGAIPKSMLTVEFDPSVSYPLVSPLDDSIISADGGNHMAVQVQLYSLFKHITKR